MSIPYQEEVSTSELFKVIMIDRKRKVKIRIQLKTKDGDEVPIGETVEKLTEWVLDKIKEEEPNACQQQITPLMGQAAANGMIKLLGPALGTVMMSQEETRYSVINMMTVGFYLLKWLQKKEITINTYEEPVTDEDLAMYDRISRASDLSVQTAALGGNPKELIKKMVEKGQLKASDLKEMGIDLEAQKNNDDQGTN